jgi:hypothetical protein
LISFLGVFTFAYTPSGGGVIIVNATGALLGSSTASVFIATWIYATATGHG